MGPEDYLRDGAVETALKELQDRIRKSPDDPKLRIFLFQLLTVEGQWERANKQLAVCGDLDPGALAMVQAYREALKCESLRGEIFLGNRTPLIFGEPERWMALLIEALKHSAPASLPHAQALREEALAEAPATSGSINDEKFEWLADADSRLGPILEVIVNGRYWWAPFHRIQQITFEAPTDLRDMIWLPAEIIWANGGAAVGLVPVRYPGTESSSDGLLRLSRKTEWLDRGNDDFIGLGQRMLTTDAADYPLLEVRQILFDTAPADIAPAAPAEG